MKMSILSRFRCGTTLAIEPQRKNMYPFQPRIAIEFETQLIAMKELSFSLPNGRRILNPISGDIIPGNLIAVMGGSGCGKSTFMNRLLGRLDGGKYGGYVTIQGEQFCDISHLQPGVVPPKRIKELVLNVAFESLITTYQITTTTF